MDRDKIIGEFQNSITKEAIAEAISRANQTFQDHAREYAAAPISA
jgi:flavin-binding protein dodecin